MQIGVLARDRGDLDAVTQHRDAIPDQLHLFQLVGDVDDADALRFDVADGLEERFGLLAAEGGRWFIHDEDFGVLRQCHGDLEHLLLGNGQIAHLRLGSISKSTRLNTSRAWASTPPSLSSHLRG